ncbi:MAG: peptidoglycan glycosyltransferase [Opitutaceae bacterium]|nr:peptidoglycan glycosyltransferase [Opitutaceae bacterium]
MKERNAERPGSLVESHKGYDPRLIFFYFGIAALLLVLGGGLAYQQLFKTDAYHDIERIQNQRRVLMPGSRGNLYDREGKLLVGNLPRFAVTLNLVELRGEFLKEYRKIRKAYRESDDRDLVSASQMEQVARYTVVERYLRQVNRTLGTDTALDSKELQRHFNQRLLLPFVLVDDLTPNDYAKLIEQLPVSSPLQIYTSTKRYYPYGSAAAHSIGYVSSVEVGDADLANFPGDELKTFPMKESVGRTGLERRFDDRLQGQAGGIIYRVDPAGYRVNPPLRKLLPMQGSNLVTSLDIDLQLAAESQLAMNELAGAAVAIDIGTGEVLALASKPDFNLADTTPRISSENYRRIEESGGWLNRAVQGVYPPGSTFKLITALAGLRSGAITLDTVVDCQGALMVGRRPFPCHDGHQHGPLKLREAIEKSCNVFFYDRGIAMGAQAIADEARRFNLDSPSGIELPFETTGMLVPDPAWKLRTRDEKWFDGDTANFAIGQGFLGVTPLQMACFVASLARGETETKPTLIHQPGRPRIRSAPINLPAPLYQAVLQGMQQCVQSGTGKILSGLLKIEGLTIAGKTGTAQVLTRKGKLNLAWFVCFAPVENPQIAISVVVEGDTPNEEFAGSRYAVPVAHAVLKDWFAKKTRRASSGMASLTTTTEGITAR